MLSKIIFCERAKFDFHPQFYRYCTLENFGPHPFLVKGRLLLYVFLAQSF